ncbi:MAG TPA: hypothetical protein VL651_00055, partial [Bacteroidia bacterium]|nr:hypothetical protein [Bacteroidia bacterium]
MERTVGATIWIPRWGIAKDYEFFSVTLHQTFHNEVSFAVLHCRLLRVGLCAGYRAYLNFFPQYLADAPSCTSIR